MEWWITHSALISFHKRSFPSFVPSKLLWTTNVMEISFTKWTGVNSIKGIIILQEEHSLLTDLLIVLSKVRLKNFFIDNHYKTIYRSVRGECSSCMVIIDRRMFFFIDSFPLPKKVFLLSLKCRLKLQQYRRLKIKIVKMNLKTNITFPYLYNIYLSYLFR